MSSWTRQGLKRGGRDLSICEKDPPDCSRNSAKPDAASLSWETSTIRRSQGIKGWGNEHTLAVESLEEI